MKTIILKWNPAFSSYTMLRFLKDIHYATERDKSDRISNWSIWDHDKVSPGDRFYMLKVGFGQTGIVARGTVMSDAYQGEDWSFNNRPRYYIDYLPTFMINPDGSKILTSSQLTEAIPDFEWFGGHSGIVLSDTAATTLEALWQQYIASQSEFFEKASDDNLFIAIDNDNQKHDYTIEFTRDYNDQLEISIKTSTPYFDKTLCKNIEIDDGERVMHCLKVASKRMLINTQHQQYPSANDLSRLCADLYTFGVNYRTRIHLIDPNNPDEEEDE